MQESEIEKIFETFATVKTDKNIEMSLFDFLRSACPFNYSTKSKEELEKLAASMEPDSVFWTFDFNKSRTISIDEYVAFLALNRMSSKELSKRFDNGYIKLDEFKEYMAQTKKRYNLEMTSNNLVLDSRLIKIDKEMLERSDAKIYSILFDNAEQIKLSVLLDLKKRMFDELTYYEVSSQVPHAG